MLLSAFWACRTNSAFAALQMTHDLRFDAETYGEEVALILPCKCCHAIPAGHVLMLQSCCVALVVMKAIECLLVVVLTKCLCLRVCMSLPAQALDQACFLSAIHCL